MSIKLRDCERAMTEAVFWLDADGDVWKLSHYADAPTATLERVRDGEKRGGVIGSQILENFVVLVPGGAAHALAEEMTRP